MRSAVYPERSRSGFTLIELLVVISIITLLSGFGFVSYKDFSYSQDVILGAQQIQSLLRLAQSNATSSTNCNSQGSSDWSLNFINSTTLELRCNPNNYLQKSYILENAHITSIHGSSCGARSTLPFYISFSNRLGVLRFSSPGALDVCLSSATWNVVITSKNNPNKVKVFTITKGGAVNVQ